MLRFDNIDFFRLIKMIRDNPRRNADDSGFRVDEGAGGKNLHGDLDLTREVYVVIARARPEICRILHGLHPEYFFVKIYFW